MLTMGQLMRAEHRHSSGQLWIPIGFTVVINLRHLYNCEFRASLNRSNRGLGIASKRHQGWYCKSGPRNYPTHVPVVVHPWACTLQERQGLALRRGTYLAIIHVSNQSRNVMKSPRTGQASTSPNHIIINQSPDT